MSLLNGEASPLTMTCLFFKYGTAGNALSIRASVWWHLTLDSLLILYL